MTKLIIRKAAVLGAGVMGAQIAAHLANAGVEVVLFDLATKPKTEGEKVDKNAIINRALVNLKKLQPTPLGSKSVLKYITAANYDDDLETLKECDLVIEAIAERMDWKTDLYHKVGPFLSDDAIVASNTSGLSINELSDALPEYIRDRFCGVHFFNPPRYMALVELIATKATKPEVVDALESWLVSRLGKSVVRAFDTPNFIANRIGVFSILAVIHHTKEFNMGFDLVDALTGPKIGRPKSATYRTADVVGLDTMKHAIETMRDLLPNDAWHKHFNPPEWLNQLVAAGALGQKTRVGIFKKVGKDILTLNPENGEYRPSDTKIDEEVDAILKIKNPAEKFAALRKSNHPQAQFLWAIFRDVFQYAAVQLENIADNARDVDFAIRWGFGWAQGPFETWQAAGWKEIASAIAEDIAAGKTLSDTPLPAWVTDGRDGVHTPEGSWSPSKNDYVPRSDLAVYKRQLFLEPVLGDGAKTPEKSGKTLYENDGVRLWTLDEVDSGIGILSIKSKMHTIGDEVLDGVLAAIAQAETTLDGVVMWHEAPFAVGANLMQVTQAIGMVMYERLEQTVEKFQRASQALKYSQIPVITAIQGMALGGGCEFAMHSNKRVMAFESYIGLVEAGVGLIPAGGGCKEFAIKAAEWAGHSATPKELFNFLQPVFQTIAMAKVAGSAIDAIEIGFAKDSDTILFNARELLFVAIKEARAMADVGFQAPIKARDVVVAGRTGIANMEMMLINMLKGNMISQHDYLVAKYAATALCGGDIEAGSLVDEEWLLTQERRLFVELLKNPLTQARIKHTLETGKPLRN